MRIAGDAATRRERIRHTLYHLAGRASLLAPVQRVEHVGQLVEAPIVGEVCAACVARQPDPPLHQCLEERQRYLDTLSEIDRAWATQWWMATATAGQMPPAGQWDVWVAMRGRGAGKTWTGANQVIDHAFWLGPKARIGIFTRTSRSTDTETVTTGPSGIMTVSPRDFLPRFIPTRNRFEWPNGAQASLYTAEEPNQARGPEFTFIWADEVMNWERPETWHQLQFGLRNKHAECRIIATTTPTPSDFSRQVLSSPGTVVTTGSMFSNAHNLSPRYIKKMIETYGGTRRGRQELYGDMLTDAVGALWKAEWFDRPGFRCQPPVELKMVVVAIDPAVTSKPDSDETGIVVAGLGSDGLYYVLADYSGVYQAETWATVAIQAYHHHQADCIIAEVNNGGDLVERNIRAVSPDVSYASVRASRGKEIRATPAAALYERDMVRHAIGVDFEKLERQLCEWSPITDAVSRRTKSPDRLDALVWALNDLIDGGAVEDGPGGIYGAQIDPNDLPM